MGDTRTPGDRPRDIHWTAATRERVHPRRGNTQERKVEIDRLLRAMRRVFAPWAEWYERGEAFTDDTCRSLMQQVRERLMEAHEPPGGLNLEVEAVRALMLDGQEGIQRMQSTSSTLDPEMLISWWVARQGADFATAVLARTWFYRLSAQEAPETVVVHRAQKLPESSEQKRLRFWPALRRALAVAPGSEYELAFHLASGMRENAPRGLRHALSYAFPDHPAWAESDAREVLAEDSLPTTAWCLLASLADLELVNAMIDAALAAPWSDGVRPYVFTIVDQLGVQALGPLQRLLLRGRSATLKREAARGLALIERGEVADLFVDHLSDKDLREIIAEYCQRYPRISIPVLHARQAAGDRNAARLLSRIS
ncbi:MAG: hypothetical protein ACYCW6_14465 [Candidatus Xenobia bacterium]